MTKHFVGSKNGAGVKQWLINLMPAHRVYVEPFLGKGAVVLSKRPAAETVIIDCEAGAVDDCRRRHSSTNLTAIVGNAMAILPLFKIESDWLIYADPPYLGSSRSCNRRYYKHELRTAEEHGSLLSILTALPGQVMISGYWSDLYSERLKAVIFNCGIP